MKLSGRATQRRDAAFTSFLFALILLVMGAAASLAGGAEKTCPRLLALDFEVIDTSGEPNDQRDDHARRIALMREEILKQFEATNAYQIVGREKIAVELAAILDHTYLRSCNGCEFVLGEHAGADLIMMGQINKISTLLMNMRVWIKNVSSHETVFFQSFDFRGDNDNSWMRAARYFGRRVVGNPPG